MITTNTTHVPTENNNGVEIETRQFSLKKTEIQPSTLTVGGPPTFTSQGKRVGTKGQCYSLPVISKKQTTGELVKINGNKLLNAHNKPLINETYDITLGLPKGFVLTSGQSVHILSSLSDACFEKDAKANLLDSSEIDLEKLRPGTTRGLDWSGPTDVLLTMLAKKVKVKQEAGEDVPHGDRLQDIVHKADMMKELQTNYTVIDVLKLFPKMLSAKDLYEGQTRQTNKDGIQIPKNNSAKTYTPDARLCETEGTMRINVQKVNAPAVHRLFDEPNGGEIVEQSGATSDFLCGLEKGHETVITMENSIDEKGKVKDTYFGKGTQIPEFSKDVEKSEYIYAIDDAGNKTDIKIGVVEPSDRSILFVPQGNSAIKFLHYLEDIRKRKANGEPIGPVRVALCAKTANTLLEENAMREYVKSGVISELHLVLSKEDKADSQSEDLGDHGGKVLTHYGQRVTEFEDNHSLFSKEGANGKRFSGPWTMIAGGQAFVAGNDKIENGETILEKGKVLTKIAELFGYKPSKTKIHGDIIYTQARDGTPSEQKEAVQTFALVKKFQNIQRRNKIAKMIGSAVGGVAALMAAPHLLGLGAVKGVLSYAGAVGLGYSLFNKAQSTFKDLQKNVFEKLFDAKLQARAYA